MPTMIPTERKAAGTYYTQATADFTGAVEVAAVLVMSEADVLSADPVYHARVRLEQSTNRGATWTQLNGDVEWSSGPANTHNGIVAQPGIAGVRPANDGIPRRFRAVVEFLDLPPNEVAAGVAISVTQL